MLWDCGSRIQPQRLKNNIGPNRVTGQGMLRVTLFCSLAMLILSPIGIAGHKASRVPMVFTATAFSGAGVTTKGNVTQAGTAAADPSVIPLGSKVRVTGAGAYSGVYCVTDTGQKVGGRTIDLYIPNVAAAKAFGRKQVRVQIISVGDNVKNQPETTPTVSKSQLAPAQKGQAATTR